MADLSALTGADPHPPAPTTARAPSRNPSLRRYFLVILASALTIPTLIFGTMQANKWDAASRDSYDHRLRLAAYRLSSDVGAFMHAQAFSIQAAARVAGALDEWELSMVRDVIEGVYNPRFFSGVFLADASGRSVVFAPSNYPGEHAGVDYSDRSYFAAVQREQRLVMTEAIMGRKTKTPIMTIAAPVFSPDGAWRGLVAGGVRQTSLNDLVDSFREKTSDDRILILDGRDNVLLDTSRRLKVLQNVGHMAAFDTSRTRDNLTIEDETGELVRVFRHHVSLPGESWTVCVMTPMSVIDKTANSARAEVSTFAFYLVGLAFVFALLGSVLAGRALRRVRALTISLGDPDFRAPRRESSRWTPREIADLMTSGNQSIERLRDALGTNRSLVKRLKSNEARILPLASAWDHIDDAIEFTYPDGTVMFSNPTAVAFDRTDEHASADEDASADRSPSARRSTIFAREELVDESFWVKVRAGATWRRDYTEQVSGGEHRRLSVAVSPVTDNSGEIMQFVIIRRDITDTWQQERAAKRNERLAALGTMAATVAHEINNPLTYIRANLEDLSEQLADPATGMAPDLRENFGQALHDALVGASRVADIVKRMLTLVRDEADAQDGCCEVRPVAENAVAVTMNEVRHRGTLTTRIDPDLWIPIRESSLFQLLVNLIHNAAQAYDERSGRPNHIRVETTTLHHEGRDLVRLLVSDQGCGMPPEVLERIFDPFFTTKKIGHGTGLGLSVCQSIIEGAGGTLDVESAVDEGTTVRILIPLVPPAAAGPTPSAPHKMSASPSDPAHASPSDGRETPRPRILVIDDEPAVGRVIQRILRGYDVTLLDSSHEALRLLKTATFDLIISDVMMPDVSGPRIWQLIARTRPDLRDSWVFISGGIFDPGLKEIIADSRAALLDKPLRADVLRDVVAERLAARDAPAST